MTIPWLKKSGVYLIGEAGSNWYSADDADPDLDGFRRAVDLIETAAKAGVDAVKFQVFSAAPVYAPNAGFPDYLPAQGSDAPGEADINDLFRKIGLPHGWLPHLHAAARSFGLDFLASAFSFADIDAVDPFVAAHKIASYEITDLPLIRHAAGKGKPLLLSTGGAGLEEVEAARDAICLVPLTSDYFALLHCAAAYPAPPEGCNLCVIETLRRRWTVVGLSDHTEDPTLAPVAAVALGAKIIEKHFTLDRTLNGPDHRFALDPPALRRMVEAVRAAERMMGDGVKQPQACELPLRRFAQRRLQATRDIRAGETLRYGENFLMLRPGRNEPGGDACEVEALNGTPAHRDFKAGEGIRRYG